MKRIFTLIFLLFCSLSCLLAQDFPGYRTGNYTGVNGAFYNPASIVSSPYRFDINLISVSALLGNGEATFKLKDLSGTNFSDQIFGTNAGNINGLANISASLPSFMFNVNPKTTLAVTTRARVLLNINDMNAKFLKKVTEDFSPTDLPLTITSKDNMILNVSGWTEYGLTVARVLHNKDGNKLKGGITVKYLAGAANAYININNLGGTINADIAAQDAYLNNTTGGLGLGFSGVNISNFAASDLTKFNGSGVGADIGLVYEWTKPVKEEAREEPDSVASARAMAKRLNQNYKFRLGISLLDAGKIGFTRDVKRSAAYDIQITGAKRYYFSNFDGLEVDNIKQKFDGQPQYFTPKAGSSDGTYSVTLPTSLNLDADLRFGKMIFVNAAGQIALTDNKSNVYDSRGYSSFTFTPRLETRAFGLFFPINYNELTQSNIGVGLRMGPLVVGSGSLISSFTGSSKQADLYFGLHVGFLKKRSINSDAIVTREKKEKNKKE